MAWTISGTRRGLVPNCSFVSCDRPHSAKGYCKSHYEQKRTGRGIEPIKKYRTRQPGIVAAYFPRGSGYVQWDIHADRGRWLIGPEHRILMEKHLGRPLTDKETVHHK